MGSVVQSCCSTRADYSFRQKPQIVEPVVSQESDEERYEAIKGRLPIIKYPELDINQELQSLKSGSDEREDISSIGIRTPAQSNHSETEIDLLRIESWKVPEETKNRTSQRFNPKKQSPQEDEQSSKHYAYSVLTPKKYELGLRRCDSRARSTKSAIQATRNKNQSKKYSQFRLNVSEKRDGTKSCTNLRAKSVFTGFLNSEEKKQSSNLLQVPSSRKTDEQSGLNKTQLNELINNQKINFRKKLPYDDHYTDSNMLQEPNIYVLNKCMHKNSQIQRVAKKYLKLPDLPSLPRFVEVEIHLLQQLPHTTMPSLIEVFDTPQKYVLILESIHGWSLLELVNYKLINNLLFKENEIQVIMYQLLSLAKHLHKRQYVVRDFKPESIRFTKANNDVFSLKVMSFFGTTKKKAALNRRVGSYAYMAPQILKNHSYDERCDVYSLGVILYILMTLNHPFENQIYRISDEGKFIFCKQRIEQPDYKKIVNFNDPKFRSYSFDLQRLCKRMLEFNPTRRITSDDAYSSRFLHDTWDKMQKTRNQELGLTFNKDIFLMARSFGVNGFRKAVFKFALPILFNNDESRRELYEDLYRKIDLNADGVLSRYELKKALKKVRGMSREDREFFANSLTKRKGFITKEDFIISALVVDFSNNRKIIREIFDYLDSDGSGQLNQQELCSIFKNDSVEFSSLQLMLLEDMDINNDQQITFEEFYNYLMKRAQLNENSFYQVQPASTGGIPQARSVTPPRRRT